MHRPTHDEWNKERSNLLSTSPSSILKSKNFTNCPSDFIGRSKLFNILQSGFQGQSEVPSRSIETGFLAVTSSKERKSSNLDYIVACFGYQFVQEP